MSPRIAVGLLGVGCVVVMWLISHLYRMLLDAYEQSASLNDIEYSWFFRLLLNLVGYSTVLLPLFICYKYLERTNYFDKITTSHSPVSRALFACFGDPGERLPDSGKARAEGEGGAREGAELAFCFTGLMGSYLVWGLLQEKIMTTNYTMPDGSSVKFTDSQFLVFVNRLTAFLVAGARLVCTRRPLVGAPLYKLSYCALTNVLSAWCQYEALKYVSFPTQVLSKSCKVLPVMLMGKLISRSKYEPYEYATAALISVGMVMFMFGSHDDHAVSSMSTASGMCLLALYMVCDSFTASWQGAVAARHGCGALQLLLGVNLFSIALAAAARPLAAASLPLLTHPAFVADCAVLSLSSTLGQLFIYRTIARFGAVLFTIIMTLRQAVSILVSCAVYGHAVSRGGAAGVCAVFAAALLRACCRQRLRSRARQPTV